MKGLVILNKSILFLCTGNSCRSQIAEGLAKEYLKNYDIESAGTNPEPVNSMAVEVMKEINIDISHHDSKSITEEKIQSFDIVVTLCGGARDNCFNIMSFLKKHIHWNLDDPAKIKGSNREKLIAFRDIRNQIENNIKNLEKNFK